MIRAAIGLAVLASAFQAGQAEEKPKLPPFTLVVTAKTGKLVPGDLAPLVQAIRGMKGYAEQISRERVPGDTEWHEDWTFQIPGDKKFDPGPLARAFATYNARKFHLTMTGTLSQEAQTKKLFITSYSGKSKVKLMNRPRNPFDDPDKKSEDTVAKLAELLNAGKPHYTVGGEIYNHGGTLAILLATYEEAAPPPPAKEGKK